MIASIAAILAVGVLGWIYKTIIQPPPPKLCGSPGGPTVNSPRIKLRDGRHLAYKEAGTPKDKAKYKIILVHAFNNSKDNAFPASQELMDELGIYFLSFDRAGYGESDPNPKRSVKSEAMDILELADQLQIGPKFYLVGVSMGNYAAWSCLNYIPHRVAGAALVVPVVNYWWPSLPADLSQMMLDKFLAQDRRTFWIAHHAPSLLYAWLTQKWLPSLSALQGDLALYSPQDQEVLKKMAASTDSAGAPENKACQQGVHESLYRDLMVLFSNWDFDPLAMRNPYPNGEGSVHIWQGYEDRFIPVEIQQYLARKLPWVRYHEIPEAGHLFIHADGWSDTILKALLLPEPPTTTSI